MSARERRDVEAGLERKGFERDERHHHYFIYWSLGGKKTAIRTRTSHGSTHRTLGDALLSQMARQCGSIRKADFLDLVDCPLAREDFERLVGLASTEEIPNVPPES